MACTHGPTLSDYISPYFNYDATNYINTSVTFDNNSGEWTVSMGHILAGVATCTAGGYNTTWNAWYNWP